MARAAAACAAGGSSSCRTRARPACAGAQDGVCLQRGLKRLERFGLVVLLEKQTAPRGFYHRRIAAGAFGVAIERVGVAGRLSACAARPARRSTAGSVDEVPRLEDSREERVGVAALAVSAIQQRELERRVTRLIAG